MVDHYELLAKLHDKQGNVELAYTYYQKQNILVNELNQKRYNNKLELITSRFELEEKQRKIDLQAEQLESARYKAKVEEQASNIFIIIIIALSLLLAISVISFLKIRTQKKELAQNQIEIISKNESLAESLDKSEILLSELNHRVKNNLSVLSSMLYLQNDLISNEEAKDVLQKIQSRISAIALVHEHLYRSKNLKSIDLQDYLDELIQSLKTVYANQQDELKVFIHCKEFNPPLSVAIPLGMIIHELFINSIKYARPAENLEIHIDFESSKLSYKDNGQLFSTSDVKESKSFGMKIINIFTAQLNSEFILHEESEGFSCVIEIDPIWLADQE